MRQTADFANLDWLAIAISALVFLSIFFWYRNLRLFVIILFHGDNVAEEGEEDSIL